MTTPHVGAPEAGPPNQAPSPPSDTAATMSVSLNGEPRHVPRGITVGDLVTQLTNAPTGIAAALNESVIPRHQWSSTPLQDGDHVEVLTAVQGG